MCQNVLDFVAALCDSLFARIKSPDVSLLYIISMPHMACSRCNNHDKCEMQGPTSFTDLDSMLGEPSKLGSAATGQTDSKRQYDRKPSLLGRLAGQQNLNSLREVSANDLQGVLSSSFGSRFTGRKQSNGQ